MLGRTGNNMFQYAIGRVLAEKHGVPLIMDASWFNQDGWSQVSHFLKLPLKAKIRRSPSLASRVFQKITGKHYWEYRGAPIFRESETDQSFHEIFLNAPADCMLFGYFQTPRYFESIEENLRVEFRNLIAHGHSVEPELQAHLSTPGSVAVHVRRTDYLNIPALAVCGENYYKAAMNKMRERVADPRFFIFSDDPDWCRREFTGPDTTIVSETPPPANPLHDLHLMSLTSHHIIANSTYSWWAAWIAKNPSQQVMMPDRWVTNETLVPISEKRLPHWTIIPTHNA